MTSKSIARKASPLIAIKPVGTEVIASARLRAYLPVRHLRDRGVCVEIYRDKNLEKYDLVIFQKAYSDSDLALAKKLRSLGCKVVLDQCDNHFIYRSCDSDLKHRAERLCNFLDVVDVVFVSTAKLGELFDRKPVFIVPDYIELPRPRFLTRLWLCCRYPRMFFRSSVKLVWFGNAGSSYPKFGMCDIAEKISLLEELAQTYDIELTIVSNSEGLFRKYFSGEVQFPVFYVKWKRKSFDTLLSLHDVCLIPVESNSFTVCKTNNRLVLALLHGLPVVADEIPSYSEFSSFSRLNDWRSNLIRVLEDYDQEKVRADQGKQYILSKYTNDYISDFWESAIRRSL